MTPSKILKLTLIVILLLPIRGVCMKGRTDSLWHAVKAGKEDTLKVKALMQLCKIVYITDTSRRIDSLIRATLNLSIKLNYEPGIAASYSSLGTLDLQRQNDSAAIRNFSVCLKLDTTYGNVKGLGTDYTHLGLVYKDKGNYPEALRYLLMAKRIEETYKDSGYEYYTYQALGIVYKRQGSFSEALKNYLLSMQAAEKYKDTTAMGDDYSNIGNIYMDQGNDSTAAKYYLSAQKLFEKRGDIKSLGYIYGDIGNIDYDKGDYKTALSYYKKSLEISIKTGDKSSMTTAYGNIGNVYESLGDHKAALENQYESLKLDKAIGSKLGVAEDYINIAAVFIKLKKYAVAKEDMDSSVSIAKELKSNFLLRAAYESLASLDTLTGNYKSAYYNYTQYARYSDSIKNGNITRKLVSEQMNYEFNKKQELEKAEQGKKDALADAEKRKQKFIIVFVSLGLLLVLIFSGLLFSRFRITQKQKKIIEAQKTQVEERNKEITDSIKYAKRLQDAILPPISEIKNIFPDSFVLYKPKDIVAGDFYWLAPLPQESGALIAAADCTGHGVPGAMVSVVCSNALNRAVKEFKIREPGKILDKVRELVLETFSQRDPLGEKSENDVQDGMDISLASLTPSEGGATLQWSGAYNPLWIIKAPAPNTSVPIHGASIMEIAPDKQPIGKQYNSKPFTNHSLTLQKGDCIYLFTDGYADQFGGPNGKKLKSKLLKEMLLSMTAVGMDKQKKQLQETLKSWKGNLDQVDDILIIGIRV